MQLRGEVCIGSATILSCVSLISFLPTRSQIIFDVTGSRRCYASFSCMYATRPAYLRCILTCNPRSDKSTLPLSLDI